MTTDSRKYSRRDLLKLSVAAGAGVAISAGGFGAISAVTDSLTGDEKKAKAKSPDDIVPFYGKYQAGIVTPQQEYLYLAAFNLSTDNKSSVIQLYKKWTELAEWMGVGRVEETYGNDWLPPKDTGEAVDIPPSRLTMTFGFGPSFFSKNGVDRFGVLQKAPKYLKDIPLMQRDDLQEPFIGGDICVQVCADDQQAAFHAIRSFIKAAVGTAELKWMQSGFISVQDGKTPRNLFGFKDGTANAAPTDETSLQQTVWAEDSEPDWMQNGTYMACRKIKMFLEVWDRSSLKEQEDTFGRKKSTGAPYGQTKEHDPVILAQQPPTSHTALAKGTGKQIYRRAYSYTDGVDAHTGYVDAGLMFISFQQNPDIQLIPMLSILAQQDKMNEYTKHIGSAMFACPGGIQQGEYIAKGLLEG